MKLEKTAYNITEAAQYARCGETMILGSIKNGDLIAHYPTPTTPVILREDLLHWLEHHGSRKELERLWEIIEAKDKKIAELENELSRIKETTIVNVYKPKTSPKERQVYFIRCEDFVKIGMSTDPLQRLKAIQVSGNGTYAPKNIDLSTAEIIATEVGGFDRESELHKKFDHLRHVGEWFHLSDELTDYIDGLLAKAA